MSYNTIVNNTKNKNTFTLPIVVRITNCGKQNVVHFEGLEVPYGITPRKLIKDIVELVELYGQNKLPTFYRGRHFHKDCNLTEYDKYDYVAVVKIKPTFAEWTILSFDYNK